MFPGVSRDPKIIPFPRWQAETESWQALGDLVEGVVNRLAGPPANSGNNSSWGCPALARESGGTHSFASSVPPLNISRSAGVLSSGQRTRASLTRVAFGGHLSALRICCEDRTARFENAAGKVGLNHREDKLVSPLLF